MNNLWQKNNQIIDNDIINFTVGNDYLNDQKIIAYDVRASIAHAKMLNKIGVLSKIELSQIVKVLKNLYVLCVNNKFIINPQEEDCHTAIENYLVKNCGKVGYKIHSARSRNDQVLTALRLYEKDQLNIIWQLISGYQKSLNFLISKYGDCPMAGYTHTQKAMPTTVGLWLGSFVDSGYDNKLLINSIIKLIDQNPLGSGAGFGIPEIKIDREFTSKLLGFSKVMINPIYCQMSRGKFESSIIHVLSQVMFDLNKLASDLILFSTQEFAYIELPEAICTGSSIMPNKKNPDVLEIIRAKYSVVLGEEIKIKLLIGNLISGYHRDFQLTKKPLFDAVDITKSCLNIISTILPKIKINKKNCQISVTDEIMATKKTYKLVKKGIPFRQAYQIIKSKIN